MDKIITLKYHHDSGHGWISCKKSLIILLGISDRISSYSYENGSSVYLEEDVDAPMLIESLHNMDIDYKVVTLRQSKKSSPIRGYNIFQEY